jgi:serine/threonine protein kinase/cytochrome c-type biogenesis protein CcmH/NrfG
MTVPATLVTALEDRYRLDRELGQGGMATVYLAHDLKHDRDVALKVLRPELAAVLGRERFLAEIHLTAKLDHPHILTLIDSGESAGFLWYVVPFIRGESLRQKLEHEQQLRIEEALAIIRQVADALDFAHRRGVIHRDIKPENILLQEGHAILADFGIALAVKEAGGNRLTETGLSLGTPQYMSPEQATGDRQLDARSDVYSLGAVLYEMLAGEPPHTGPTVQAVIAKLMTTPPVSLRVVRPSLPEWVDRAVTKALAKTAADRHQSAGEFAAALQDGPPAPRPSATPRPRSRITALLAVALVVGSGAATWVIGHRSGRPVRAPKVVALEERATHSYSRRTAASVTESIRDFRDVLDLDSTAVGAWAGLSKAYVRAYRRFFPVPGIPRDSVLRLGVAAADRASSLDPASPDAWLAQALTIQAVDPTDDGAAVQALRRALALDSTRAEAWVILANNLAENGDMAGAMQGWHHAVRVDPGYSEAFAFLALGYYWKWQYDSAAIWADSAVTMDPTFLLARSTAGYVALERGALDHAAAAFEAAQRVVGDVEAVNSLAGSSLVAARRGDQREARALLQQAESLATGYTPVPAHTAVYLAEAAAGLGDARRALAWLTRYQPRRDLHFQLHLRCDPPFTPLLDDPRFRSLLIRPHPPRGQGC